MNFMLPLMVTPLNPSKLLQRSHENNFTLHPPLEKPHDQPLSHEHLCFEATPFSRHEATNSVYINI